MSDLIQVGKATYYIDLPSKVGVYALTSEKVILIDSSTADCAHKIDAVLQEKGWKPEFILNTHSHVDHVGSNAFLQEKYGCPAYANGLEAVFASTPLLAGCYLYGGYPYKLMRHSFLMAKPSRCQDISLCTLPEGFETFLLSGHAIDMLAVRTPDNIWFTGDIATSEEILNKYHVAFTYNPSLYLKSLDLALTLKGDLFICSHADPVKDLKPLIEFNRAKMMDIMQFICTDCSGGPKTFDEILKDTADHYNFCLNHMLIANIGSTVRSMISNLIEERRLKSYVFENTMLYKAL